MVCVKLVLLRILCMKSRCFLGKFTQLAKFYTTAGRDGRDKSQLWTKTLMWIRNHQSSGQSERPVSQDCPLLWKQVRPDVISLTTVIIRWLVITQLNVIMMIFFVLWWWLCWWKCNHGSSTDVTSTTFSSNSNSGRIDLMFQVDVGFVFWQMFQMLWVSMIEMFKCCFYAQSLGDL